MLQRASASPRDMLWKLRQLRNIQESGKTQAARRSCNYFFSGVPAPHGTGFGNLLHLEPFVSAKAKPVKELFCSNWSTVGRSIVLRYYQEIRGPSWACVACV